MKGLLSTIHYNLTNHDTSRIIQPVCPLITSQKASLPFSAILNGQKTGRTNAKKNFCVIPAYENYYKRILDES